MATVDELLAGITTVDKTLVISNDFRTINIPSSVPNLGVEYDDDVLRLDFKMPRYISGTDLSTFAIRINYINSKGESDAYTISDAVVDNQYITFSWLVGPTATRYKGNTKFNVCAKTIKADGTVDREFNTTIATLPVLEGLEVDESIVTEYSDIIEQWKQELFGIGDTEEASIRLVSLEAQKEILQAGARVLDTIPPDYTTAVNMTDNADRTKSDAIVCTKRGEIIAASDSSDDYIRGLKIFGKTTQASTTGKNIADLRKVSAKDLKTASATAALSNSFGTTLSATSGDSITVTQSKWPNAEQPNSYQNGDIVFGFYCPLRVGDKIVISFEYEITNDPLGVGGTYFTLQLNTNYQSATMVTGNKVTLYHTVVSNSVSAADGWNYIDFRNCGTSGVISNFQIEYGDTATPYEPYTGGVASPNPEWPQELKSVENPTLSIYSKNLLKITATNQTISGVTFTINPDQSVTIKGTATASVYYGLNYDIQTMIPGERYTMSGGLEGSSGSTYRLYTQTIDGKKFYADYGKGASFVATDEQWQILFAVYKDTAVDFTIYPQLRLSSIEDASYEPYKHQPVITSEHNLLAIPVSQNGNYTDENGQQWVCDEIDFERGVYVQRIYTYELTGDERWSVSGIQSGMKEGFTRYDGTATTPGTAMNDSLWSHFTYKGTYVRDGYGAWVHNANDTRIGVRVVTPHESVDALVEYLEAQQSAGTPVQVQYVLSTPFETPLTQEEIEWFRFAHTNCPNTTVLNNAGATMELTYNADTKTYLENCFRPTDDQVQSSVDAWLTEHYTSAEGVRF